MAQCAPLSSLAALPVDQSSCFRSITRLCFPSSSSYFFFFAALVIPNQTHYSFESKLNDEYFYYSFVHRNYIVISVVSLLWKKCFSRNKMCFKFLSEGNFFGNLFKSIELIFLSNRIPTTSSKDLHFSFQDNIYISKTNRGSLVFSFFFFFFFFTGAPPRYDTRSRDLERKERKKEREREKKRVMALRRDGGETER